MTGLKKTLILSALFLLSALNVSADITPADTSTASNTNANNISVSHIVASDDNFIICTVHAYDATTSHSVPTAVTHNGDTMTQIRNDLFSGSGERNLMYYRVNPDIGTFNVTFTFTNTTNANALGCLSLKGVNTSAPIDDSDTVSYTAQSGNRGITSTATQNGVLAMSMAHFSDFGNAVSISPQFTIVDLNGGYNISSYYYPYNSGSVTHYYNNSATDDSILSQALIAAAPTPTNTPTPTPTTAPTNTPTPTPPNQSVSFNQETNQAISDTILVFYIIGLILVGYVAFKLGTFIYRR